MAIDCSGIIVAGIELNCADINAAVGVEKDLILINYENFDKNYTLASGNIESSEAGNIDGIVNIFVKNGLVPADVSYVFEGTDYSVQPNVSAEIKEDGNAWYIHSILFTAYSKESKARNVIQDLGDSRVVAVVVDRSTGYHELFGADQGLKMSALERAYTGTQTSNFYQVTLATPDVAVVREGTIGLVSTKGVLATPAP